MNLQTGDCIGWLNGSGELTAAVKITWAEPQKREPDHIAIGYTDWAGNISAPLFSIIRAPGQLYIGVMNRQTKYITLSEDQFNAFKVSCNEEIVKKIRTWIDLTVKNEVSSLPLADAFSIANLFKVQLS